MRNWYIATQLDGKHVLSASGSRPDPYDRWTDNPAKASGWMSPCVCEDVVYEIRARGTSCFRVSRSWVKLNFKKKGTQQT